MAEHLSRPSRRTTLLGGLAVLGAGGLSSIALPAFAAGNTLNAGEALESGQSLTSNNGKYTLVMQGDGNLVLYAYGTQVVWVGGAWHGDPRSDRAVMEGDGNFVVYSDGVPVWETGTQGANYRLVLQDDRNLVIYAPDDSVVWLSNTWYVPATEVPILKENERVGYRKKMTTKGTLYRSGLAMCSVSTNNKNYVGGLRGKVLLVVVDEGGHSIWVSKEFAAAVRCSVPDTSCASNGQETFSDNFPEVIGRYAHRVDVYQADTPSFGNVRDDLIKIIKGTGDVLQEIKNVWDQLN